MDVNILPFSGKGANLYIYADVDYNMSMDARLGVNL